MGLLRGMARTAVVAGTATAVSNRVSRRQAQRWAAEDESYSQPAPQPQADDTFEKLQQLGKLKEQGVLTQEEFELQKTKLLNY